MLHLRFSSNQEEFFFFLQRITFTENIIKQYIMCPVGLWSSAKNAILENPRCALDLLFPFSSIADRSTFTYGENKQRKKMHTQPRLKKARHRWGFQSVQRHPSCKSGSWQKMGIHVSYLMMQKIEKLGCSTNWLEPLREVKRWCGRGEEWKNSVAIVSLGK